jgi:hypothetical protein
VVAGEPMNGLNGALATLPATLPVTLTNFLIMEAMRIPSTMMISSIMFISFSDFRLHPPEGWSVIDELFQHLAYVSDMG